jgi:hypothetical protein
VTVDDAVDVIARHILARAAVAAECDWDEYPEVGETDWNAVLDRVVFLAPYPDEAELTEATAVLEARAE